jgi:hypothetical protein
LWKFISPKLIFCFSFALFIKDSIRLSFTIVSFPHSIAPPLSLSLQLPSTITFYH